MTPEQEEERRRKAEAALLQRVWRWKQMPVLLKRLPGGKHQWVVKKFDQDMYNRMSQQDVKNAFDKMARLNRWIK